MAVRKIKSWRGETRNPYPSTTAGHAISIQATVRVQWLDYPVVTMKLII